MPTWQIATSELNWQLLQTIHPKYSNGSATSTIIEQFNTLSREEIAKIFIGMKNQSQG